jgi:hypothetical protein
MILGIPQRCTVSSFTYSMQEDDQRIRCRSLLIIVRRLVLEKTKEIAIRYIDAFLGKRSGNLSRKIAHKVEEHTQKQDGPKYIGTVFHGSDFRINGF